MPGGAAKGLGAGAKNQRQNVSGQRIDKGNTMSFGRFGTAAGGTPYLKYVYSAATSSGRVL